MRPGLVIGHEPVGVIHELGVGVTGYEVGDRVLVGAITPCGQCNYCLGGDLAQCGGPIGGWKFGNTINGAQAEYLLVPSAQANLAKIPDELTDEQVVLLADIASTGISAAESANLQIGDTAAVFAQGPIGLCATAGAKLKGASLIIAVESDPVRTRMSKRMGADIVLNQNEVDVVAEIKRLTGGKGVDVAIEALGTQATFENALRVIRAGRNAFEPRRVLGQTFDSRRAVCRRPGQSENHHNALPRRKRADAQVDRTRAPRPPGPGSADHAHLFTGQNRRRLQAVWRAAGRRDQSRNQAVNRSTTQLQRSERAEKIHPLRFV